MYSIKLEMLNGGYGVLQQQTTSGELEFDRRELQREMRQVSFIFYKLF